jgi:biotin operon repressor
LASWVNNEKHKKSPTQSKKVVYLQKLDTKMQLQLPFFQSGTKLINDSLGYYAKDDFVYYVHNGNPIYCHQKDDRNSYRFILGNLVHNKLCTIRELHESLGEARKNIERYAQTFREKGASHFFSRKETRGQCYKITPELQKDIQRLLDEGWSYYRIAKEYAISESAIRYHINNGNLKKKVP